MWPIRIGLLTVLIAFLVSGVPARAELPKTPYEAVVVQDETYVRSGPGQKMYYPTSVLKRGDRVIVRRHDPGGWFMVDPPADSFSWIAKEFVRREGDDRGVVTTNNFVRIGSGLGDRPQSIRHLLTAGEQIEILDEATIQTERGPIAMYKIKPPQGEYRWIPGAALVTVEQYASMPQPTPSSENGGSKTQGGDPFAPSRGPIDGAIQPVEPPQPSAVASGREGNDRNSGAKDQSQDKELGQRPLVRITKDGTVTEQPIASTVKDQQRQRLESLDDEFRQIIGQEISAWDFSALARSYRDLQTGIEDPILAQQLQLRLDAVDRYEQKQKEYNDFLRLTGETTRRDARLLSIQRDRTPKRATSDWRAKSTNSAAPEKATPLPAKSHRRFDGAGIIQRAASPVAGGPTHVLLTPDGRVLAYLQGTPEVNLDQHLGRSVGLYGQRSYRADLRTDFMIVEGLAPVRLRP